MNITLTRLQAHTLAEQFAATIHGRVVEMHLRAAWGQHPDDTGVCPYRPWPGDEFAEMRLAIASVTNRDDRRELIGLIRFHFERMRRAKRTAPKWQDYVASVAAHGAEIRQRRRAALELGVQL